MFSKYFKINSKFLNKKLSITRKPPEGGNFVNKIGQTIRKPILFEHIIEYAINLKPNDAQNHYKIISRFMLTVMSQTT